VAETRHLKHELWRIALVGYHSMPYIFRKFFSCTTVASQIACLYLEPFRSNLASSSQLLLTRTFSRYNSWSS